MNSITHVKDEKKELVGDVHRLTLLGFRLVDSNGVMVHNGLASSLVEAIKAKKDMNLVLVELKKSISEKKVKVFS